MVSVGRLWNFLAAFLEPDILVIDEVLAVGDSDFQKKCLQKMEDVGKHGRTVLFVSHNMQMVTRLCSRAILLEKGQIKDDGAADKVVASYLSSGRVYHLILAQVTSAVKNVDMA